MFQTLQRYFWTSWTWKKHYVSVFAFAATILALNTIQTVRQAGEVVSGDPWSGPAYVTCEEAKVGSLTLVNRVERRIECLRSAPEPRPKKFPGFLTHHFSEVTDLGEFLFMAASTIGLAALCSKSVGFLENRPFANTSRLPTASDKLLLAQQFTVKSNLYEVYSEDFIQKVTAAANRNDAVALDGPLQSWKYFSNSRDELRYYFAFSKKTYRAGLNKLLSLLRKKGLDHEYMRNAVLVGVDVRWTKMLPILRNTYDVMSDEYLLRVTEKLARQYDPAVFVVFSNDPDYARSVYNGRQNFVHVKPGNQEVDMALLSMMDYVVLTSGSFGWWSAYLSNAKEVYYFSHIQDGNKVDYPVVREHYYPANWVAFDILQG